MQQGVFDDGGHDGGVRICVSSRVTVGSRHDLSKIARIFGVRCREVLKTCTRGFSLMMARRQVGRAACRERVWMAVDAVSLKKRVTSAYVAEKC